MRYGRRKRWETARTGLMAVVLLAAMIALPAFAAAADVEAAIPLQGPIANPDAYQTYQETALSVAAPGVLANDSPGNLLIPNSVITDMVVPVQPSLIATLPTTPANGTLKLNEDGSFVYTPNSGFIGTDTFTYSAQLVFPLVDATAQGFLPLSSPTTVSVTVLPTVVDMPISRFIVSRRRAFEVYGFMLPGHPEGSKPITLYCYRWERRRWVLRQTEEMTAYNFPRATKYGGWIRLRRTGRWRLVAVHQNPGGTPTFSAGRILYVR